MAKVRSCSPPLYDNFYFLMLVLNMRPGLWLTTKIARGNVSIREEEEKNSAFPFLVPNIKIF